MWPATIAFVESSPTAGRRGASTRPCPCRARWRDPSARPSPRPGRAPCESPHHGRGRWRSIRSPGVEGSHHARLDRFLADARMGRAGNQPGLECITTSSSNARMRLIAVYRPAAVAPVVRGGRPDQPRRPQPAVWIVTGVLLERVDRRENPARPPPFRRRQHDRDATSPNGGFTSAVGLSFSTSIGCPASTIGPPPGQRRIWPVAKPQRKLAQLEIHALTGLPTSCSIAADHGAGAGVDLDSPPGRTVSARRAGYPLDGRVEVVEPCSMIRAAISAPKPRRLVCVVGDHHTHGLAHRVEDRLDVERARSSAGRSPRPRCPLGQPLGRARAIRRPCSTARRPSTSLPSRAIRAEPNGIGSAIEIDLHSPAVKTDVLDEEHRVVRRGARSGGARGRRTRSTGSRP